jgi:hypothetical protein
MKTPPEFSNISKLDLIKLVLYSLNLHKQKLNRMFKLNLNRKVKQQKNNQ